MAKQKLNITQIVPYKNLIINGSCRVAQRVTPPNLSTSSQYGKVDRFRVHATGTAVNAGTINQSNADSISTSGSALSIASATITGTGIIFVKHRIESRDAAYLVNQTASFSCVVSHNVGSSINYTITIRKPTVVDNFASVTDIQVGSAQSVATGTTTTIKLENVSMGDVTNGIEIEVKAECGAVTTKTFKYCDFQLNKGTAAMEFVPSFFEEELRNCQRYYEKSYLMADAPGTTYADVYYNSASNRDNGGGNAFNGVQAIFKVTKRVAPTMAWYNPITGAGTTHAFAGGVTGSSYTSAGATQVGENSAWYFVNTTNSDFHLGSCWTADAEL